MRGKTIKPYLVEDSGLCIDELFSHVNRQLYLTYGGKPGPSPESKVFAGSLHDFQRLLESLTGLAQVRFVTHRELLSHPGEPETVRVAIRHDVDADIVAAWKLAEIERQQGVRASWYVLHTASYYGRFEGGIFRRHECMAHVYRAIQDLGHEVALHNDALHVYQREGLDGACALKIEIEWLRQNRIDVRGTVAHNSKPVYGAWNYEIFKGRYDPRDSSRGEDRVVHDGRWAPLRVVDEKSLGLEYEGNDIFLQKDRSLEYGAIRSARFWRWNRHLRRLAKNPGSVDTAFIEQERMVEEISCLPPGRDIVLVVHPCYYGARDRSDRSPPSRLRRIVCSDQRTRGWFAYDRERTQSWSGEDEQDQEFQTFTHPNKVGMLDLAWPRKSVPGIRLLCVGSDNLDGLPVPLPLQAPRRLEELIGTRQPALVRKLAFPGMGIDRLWPWIEAALGKFRPAVVILGVGDQAVRRCLPLIWSRETGVSSQYPAGDYLSWDERTGMTVVVRSSPEWRLHRRDPFRLDRVPGTDLPVREIMAQENGFMIGGLDCCELVERHYRYVAERIRETRAVPILLVEELGEAAGVFHGEKNPDEATAYQTNVLRKIERIAENLCLPLINPYEVIGVDPSGIYHHRTDRRWTAAAHRVVADLSLRLLRDKGLV